MTDEEFVYTSFLESIPNQPDTSICEWAKKHVRLVGSARSEQFDCDLTPWLREPIESARTPGKTTLVKPIQSGGSTAGEVVICHQLATATSGDVAYFWQNDLSADGRWSKRFEKILLACKPVMARTSPDRFKWTKGLVIFPHLNLEMKGVRSDRAVASDSFKLIVNEELHDQEGGWEPGKLQQTYGRQTAHWNSLAFNISNAGFVGSDLHKAFQAGQQRHWEVLCPSCGQYHELRCRWEDSRPDLGGLRYNADGCRLGNGDYDYNKLALTVFYQMPCGWTFRDDIIVRRSLSKSGRYGAPKNPGAMPNDRSFTYEAVSVDFISFLSIIQRKHAALKSLRTGDYKAWFDFLREVECKFVDVGRDRPAPERVTIISSEKKKSREGLPNRDFRFAYADWQRGRDGQPSHFFLLILDFAPGHILVVYEGRIDTEGELVAVLNDHGVKPICVTVDTSWDTTNMYNLCLRRGYNGCKADDKSYWKWEDGSERFYAEPRPLCMIANAPISQPDDPSAEPDFFLYSKYVTMERLIYLRQSKEVKFEIPSDVSEDFVNHFDSWELEIIRQRDGQSKMKWRQKRDDDHLFQCGAGVLVMADLAGVFTGVGASIPNSDNQSQPEAISA